MMRLAAAILLAFLVAVPLVALPSPPVTWLAMAALLVGGAGIVALSVALVTAAASLAVIAYTLALVITGALVEPIGAILLGATLVLLLALVHFADRVRGAAIGPSVIASQVRRWLVIVAVGVVAAVTFAAAGAMLRGALQGAALPIVVAAAALGAVMTVAGVIALIAVREEPSV